METVMARRRNAPARRVFVMSDTELTQAEAEALAFLACWQAAFDANTLVYIISKMSLPALEIVGSVLNARDHNHSRAAPCMSLRLPPGEEIITQNPP
jgi:hypothetical protein